MPAALRNLNADYDDKDAEESDPDEHDTIAALDERVDAATAQLKSKGKGKAYRERGSTTVKTMRGNVGNWEAMV